MANEYDMTSGYLGAKQLKQDKEYKDAYLQNQKAETEFKAGYYKSAADENAAKAGLYRQQTQKSLLDQGLTRGRAKEMGIDLDSYLGDIANTGSYMGVEGTFKPRVQQRAPMQYGLTDPAQQNNTQAGADGYLGIQPQRIRGYVHGGLVQHFNDGSVGAVRDQEDYDIGQAMLAQQAQQEAVRTKGISPNPNTQVDANGQVNTNETRGMTTPTDGTTIPTQGNTQGINRADEIKPPVDLENSQESPFQTLARDNPNVAKTTYNQIKKETSNFKNLSKSLLALQKFDYIEGKVTTKGMLENVQALQKMQNEGFFSAVNEVIYGDNNKALEMYKEFGDDKAQDVKSLTTFDIQEDVPNSKVKEKRKGVLVTYDDGTSRKIDPKKLIIDAVSATKFIDYGQAVTKDLREGEDKDLDRASQDAYKNLLSAERGDKNLSLLQEKVSLRVGNDFKNEFDRVFKAFLDPANPSYIGDEAARAKKADEITAMYRPAQYLAQSNIVGENYRISAPTLMEAAKQMKDPSFIDNQNNFVLGKNGTPLVKEILGQANYQTKGGVWIPVNLPKSK